MTETNNTKRRTLPYYECIRCRERFKSEIEVLIHLGNEHTGEGDGKFDYSANLHPSYLNEGDNE